MRTSLPLAVALDTRPTPAATTIAAARPAVVVISTALTDLAVQHTTAYIGAPGGPTAVVTLTEAADQATNTTRQRPGAELPVSHARDRLLLDHAAGLQTEIARRTGQTVAVDIAPHALELARRAFPVATA